MFPKEMKAKLIKSNKIINDIYYCLHHPEGTIEELTVMCKCRKPSVGLVERALNDWNICSRKNW